VKGSPADPDGSTHLSRAGVRPGAPRSNDGARHGDGGNQFLYEGATGPHTVRRLAAPWEFKRVWHLEPSLKDPDMLLRGAEDAALFASTDAGQT